MVAYDSIYPENEATATVTVSVTRNPNAPSFRSDNYQATIDEKFGLGSSVLEVLADDLDEVSWEITIQ